MSADVVAAADAIRGGGLAVVPTDTVYGLAATAYRRRGGPATFTT